MSLEYEKSPISKSKKPLGKGGRLIMQQSPAMNKNLDFDQISNASLDSQMQFAMKNPDRSIFLGSQKSPLTVSRQFQSGNKAGLGPNQHLNASHISSESLIPTTENFYPGGTGGQPVRGSQLELLELTGNRVNIYQNNFLQDPRFSDSSFHSSQLSGSMGRNASFRKGLKRNHKKIKLKPITVDSKVTEDVMKDWKFKDEKTRKIVEFRLLKQKKRQLKKDKRKLTATERY